MDRIKIEKVKVREISDFIQKFNLEESKNSLLPISKSRAYAQSLNPFADDSDIGLIIAYSNNQCIGYLGLVPGKLKTDTQLNKIHWLSTWYVPEQFRKTSVGLMLLMTALSLNYDLFVCSFTDEAARVYHKLRFKEIGLIQYTRIYVDPIALFYKILKIMLWKFGIRFSIPSQLCDVTVKLFSPMRKFLINNISNLNRTKVPDLAYREVDNINDNFAFDNLTSKGTEFYRDREVIKWMLNYKWRDSQKTEDENHKGIYYFSSSSDRFDYFVIEILSSEKKHEGFVIFSFLIEKF